MKSLTSRLKRESGFTVIELMIAGVLGLLLLAGVIQIFIGTKQTSNINFNVNDVQDRGRFATSYMKLLIQQAGWREPTLTAIATVGPNLNNHVLFVGDKDANGVDIVAGTDSANNLTAVGSATPSDRIVFQYHGTVDCLGQNVIPAVVPTPVAGLVINQFFLAENNGRVDLFCRGNGGVAALPLVSNVESFQVLYGVDTSGTGAAVRYVSAGDAFLVGQTQNIISVRIALLISSEDESLDSQARSFTVLNEVPLQITDGKLRRLYTTTIFLANNPLAI